MVFRTLHYVISRFSLSFIVDSQEGASPEHRIKMLNSSLQRLVYEYVCRSLFKADRLMFALHMVHGMFPDLFKENVRVLEVFLSFLKAHSH